MMETLRAFNSLALGWKIAIAAGALVAFGTAGREYMVLPAQVRAVKAQYEINRDSVWRRFDGVEAALTVIQRDGVQTRCIVLAATQQQKLSCLKG